MNLPRWNLTRIYSGEKNLNREVYQLSERLDLLKKRTTSLTLDEWKDLAKIVSEVEELESLFYVLLTEGEAQNVLLSIREQDRYLKEKVKSVLNNQRQMYARLSSKEQATWLMQSSDKIDLKRVTFSNQSIAEIELFSLASETRKSTELMANEARKQITITDKTSAAQDELSLTKANQLAFNHPNGDSKVHIFTEMNQALEKRTALFAQMYNQFIQTRLTEYRYKKVSSIHESLKVNGLSEASLQAMWNAVDLFIPKLKSYIVMRNPEESLTWHQYMSRAKKVKEELLFSEAVQRIEQALTQIDKRMGSFVREAIESGWVDAVPSEKKQGGFCAPFINKGESRISLAFDGSIDSACRLAHELGHAWHFKHMNGKQTLSFSEDEFEMTSAETASIFFETVFVDSLLVERQDEEMKSQLLSWKIEQMVHYLMSIRAAFLFESTAYKKREKGTISAEELEEISLSSQQQAYGDVFHQYEPYKWIKQTHFFISDVPFYNYSYTFGFLLSQGLVELAKRDNHFSMKFSLLLSETGKAPIEELMMKHFQINLSSQDFWLHTIEKLSNEIEHWHLTQ